MSAQNATRPQVNGVSAGTPEAGTSYGATFQPVNPIRDDREQDGRNSTGAATEMTGGVSTVVGMAVDGAEGSRSSANDDVPMGSTMAGASVPEGELLAGDGVVEPKASTEIGAQRFEAAAGLARAVADAGVHGLDVQRGDEDQGVGYSTPRSIGSQFPGLRSARQPGQGNWAEWMSRLSGMFSQPVVTNWLPSPIPSPPRPPTVLQRRNAADVRAGDGSYEGMVGVRGSSGPHITQTPSSSSIPAEAIQAEVQRQLGSILDRLAAAEDENQRLHEALRKERMQGLRGPPPLPARAQVPREDPVTRGQGLGGADEALGARGVLPKGSVDPWAALWEGLSGKFGARAKAGAARPDTPPPSIPEVSPATVPPVDLPDRREQAQPSDPAHGMLEALTRSMKQLQELQLKNMQKDTVGDGQPEIVKTATVSLPELSAPTGITSGLVLQDWLVQVTTCMQDLSASSGEWWEEVREMVSDTYSVWLQSTPLERLQVGPKDHQRLTTGRWTRVNARACALMMQAFVESVRSDLIARRASQSAVMILFRLYTSYQPGGAGERSVVLQQLQGTEPPGDLNACLKALRHWPRWLQRCKDLNMVTPDGSLLARGLTATAAPFLSENPDAVFRTQLVRSTYRVDGQPKLEDIIHYHQHLQAEIENIASSKVSSSVAGPAIKALTTDSSTPTAPSQAQRPCKFYMKAAGCRRGGKCPFQHSLEGLSKLEKSRKCLACGAEDHRQKDCATKTGKPWPSAKSGSGGSTPSPTKAEEVSVNKAHVEPEGESSPSRTGDASVTPGQPVLTWEALLQAAAKVSGAVPNEAKAPSMKVLSITGPSAIGSTEDQAYALVDSGATHPLRRARTQSEWDESEPVVVHLAGGKVVELKINTAGTLLVPLHVCPRTSSSSPIVPLGSLVGMLGYTLEWSGSRCKLTGRDGEVLSLRVRDGCPEVTERQALDLISRIEDKKLSTLRKSTEVSRVKIREAVIALNKTWFDHLLAYCDSDTGSDALLGIQSAPFFQDVPEESLYGLAEAIPITNGWDALKGLKHLNRRSRRSLWASSQWVVHLYAGRRPNEEIKFLEKQGFVVLELDVERGKIARCL